MQTIGERLEEARKKKGISIREAAEATKIRGDYLQRFESNHFDIGLTEIYTRGFLRTYANFLKLPSDRLLADYAALARGETRPRANNREVYGRMDISTAEPAEPVATASDPAPEADAAPRAQPRYVRNTGSSLPTGPDPAMIFRYVKWSGIAIIVLLVLLIVKSLFSDRSGPASHGAAGPTATTTAQPAHDTTPVLTLVALNTVRVTVQKQIPNVPQPESYGEIVFEGTLNPGDTKSVPRTGGLYITASATQNLLLDVNGQRKPMGLQPGYGTGLLPAP